MNTVSRDQLSDVNLVQLVEALQDIDISSAKVKNNKDSIEDNNGGRIEL